MRALVRRVLNAEVKVAGKTTGSINRGLLIYLGIAREDDANDLKWIVRKILGLRIFEDVNGRMNEAITPDSGILLVSQFTLFGNMRKGFRPSFNEAADSEMGEILYQHGLEVLRNQFPGHVAEGSFGADMKISATDDGPVTIWIDSKNTKY
jgi:D-tyrosyl-tRNA(Tyr) deacylase